MPERPGPGLEVANQAVMVAEEPPKLEIEPAVNEEPTAGEADQIGLEKNEEKQPPKPPTLSQEVTQIIKRSDEIFTALTAVPEIRYDFEVVNQNYTEQKAALVSLDEASAIKEADSSHEAWQQTKGHLESLRPQLVALQEELARIQTENAVDATAGICELAQRLSRVALEFDSGLTKLESLENRYYAAKHQIQSNQDSAEMVKRGLLPLEPGESFDDRRRTVYDNDLARDNRPASERARDLIPFTRAWSQARQTKGILQKIRDVSIKREEPARLPDRDSYALAKTDGRLVGELVAGVYGRLLSLAQDRYQLVRQQAMFDTEDINAVEKAVIQGRLGQLLVWSDETVIPVINELKERYKNTYGWGAYEVIPHSNLRYSRNDSEKGEIHRKLDDGKRVLLSDDQYYTNMIEENIAAGKVTEEEVVELQRLAVLGSLKEHNGSLISLSYDFERFDNLKTKFPDAEFQAQCLRLEQKTVIEALENSLNIITNTEKLDALKARYPEDKEFQSRCVELERRAVIEHLKTGRWLFLTGPSELDSFKDRFPDEEFQAQCTSLEKEVIITELSNGSRQLFGNFDEFNGLKARYSDPKFRERCDELEKAGLVGFLLGDENALKNDKLRQHYLSRHSEPAIQLVLKLPDRCPLLFDKRNSQVLRTVKENFQLFITDERDVDFINNILGQYGNAGQEIISGYGECLKKEIISRDSRENVTEFLKHFRIIGPELLRGYLQARKEHAEEIYFAELQDFLEDSLSNKPMDQTQREKPYYRELLHHVFQNNAPNYGDFETTVTNCQDRPEDLDGFKREERYVINTLDAGSVRYKKGADARVIEAEAGVLSEELRAIAAENPAELNEALNTQIEHLLASLPREILPTTQLESNENKLAVLFAVQASGEGEIDSTSLEEIIWRYSLLTFGDHQNVIAGIESRCAQSPNPTYSLLTEYHALAFDNRKEALRNVFQAVASNPDLESYFQQRFVSRQEKAQKTGREDVINRMQGKFGISPTFVQQIGERLYGKEQLGRYRAELGGEAVDTHITKLIERYERVTGRFGAEKSISAKSRTKQVYGMLRSRRQATDRVLGEFIDPEAAQIIPLTRVDNELLLSLAYEEAEEKGEYNPESYFSYLSQQSVRIGNTRLSRTEAALDQFESGSGAQAKKLIGCFSKTKESALARMVGGVCVAKDNPQPGVEKENIWEMPNYIQLVLHDPETMRCQGLVLLHHFTEPDGKKILTASFNPSQGYLQVTDEASIFRGLSQVVMEFAKNNDFDMVGVSTNGTIRTNRTGGLFEKAMDERIDELERKKHDFSQKKQFSFNPFYQLDSINPIWKNDQETATPEKPSV